LARKMGEWMTAYVLHVIIIPAALLS